MIFERQVELPEPIFGFTTGDLVRVAQKLRIFRLAVAIAGHEGELARLPNLPVSFGNHLPRNAVILDMRVAVREALTLRGNLIGRHFNLASALDQFLQFFCHRVLSRFNRGSYRATPCMARSSLNVPNPCLKVRICDAAWVGNASE
jgi:hypothetical protein